MYKVLLKMLGVARPHHDKSMRLAAVPHNVGCAHTLGRAHLLGGAMRLLVAHCFGCAAQALFLAQPHHEFWSIGRLIKPRVKGPARVRL